MRVRASLKEAGVWKKDKNGDSNEAWLEYIHIMRETSKQLNVSIRELDKALWAYDKCGGNYNK